MEAEVFNALLTLISDTAVLRDYQAAALAIVQVREGVGVGMGMGVGVGVGVLGLQACVF